MRNELSLLRESMVGLLWMFCPAIAKRNLGRFFLGGIIALPLIFPVLLASYCRSGFKLFTHDNLYLTVAGTCIISLLFVLMPLEVRALNGVVRIYQGNYFLYDMPVSVFLSLEKKTCYRFIVLINPEARFGFLSSMVFEKKHWEVVTTRFDTEQTDGPSGTNVDYRG